MRKEELNLETLHTVTPEEFQQHFDVLTEEARTGNVPLRIRTEDGSSDLLLFAWDDFFERLTNPNKKNTASNTLRIAHRSSPA